MGPTLTGIGLGLIAVALGLMIWGCLVAASKASREEEKWE